MKMLNIIQCTNLGGMEQASLRVMTALQSLGVTSEVISLHPVGGLGTLLTDAGISHQGMNYRGPAGVGIIPALAGKLRASAADHVVMTGPHFAAMLGMRIAGVKGAFLAVHFHHTGVKSPMAWRWIYRLALDRFRWVTFPSEFVRAEAVALYPPMRERSLVLRYPQETPPRVEEMQRARARTSLGLAESDFVVGNAGWLIPRKRFDVFLRVAQRLSILEPRSKFLIAGGGEEEGRLKTLAKDLGISDRVIWLGWREHLGDFYESLDALLFNADWDALPVTPQEAVARGIPLVASLLNSGLREVFDPALASRVLHDHDEDELARQLLDIAHNPVASREQSNSSRDFFLKICNPASIAEQHRQLLLK